MHRAVDQPHPDSCTSPWGCARLRAQVLGLLVPDAKRQLDRLRGDLLCEQGRERYRPRASTLRSYMDGLVVGRAPGDPPLLEFGVRCLGATARPLAR